MNGQSKSKLRLITVVYWILLLYIIAALVWWFLSLEKQNEAMYQLRKEHLTSQLGGKNSLLYQAELRNIEQQRRLNITKYIGEGTTFLLLILVGAVFVYRAVRRQFRLQQQQQNFAMAITHELKTPLAVARLNLETLQKYNLDETKKAKLLQMTLQETLRLDTLINNILISSQLEGDAYKVSKEMLDLSALTADVVQQFKQRYPDRMLILEIEKDVEMEGDPVLMKLLTSNLLENANKYSPKDKPVKLVLSAKQNEIVLAVMDEGYGISNEEKKKVFEKFYRVGNEQTRKAKGTGLGLFICKKIVQDHNGTIAIKDNQPQGSIFIAQFPA